MLYLKSLPDVSEVASLLIRGIYLHGITSSLDLTDYLNSLGTFPPTSAVATSFGSAPLGYLGGGK